MPVTYSSSIRSEVTIIADAPSSDTQELFNQTSDTLASFGQTGERQDGGASLSAVLDASAFGTDTLAVASGAVEIVDQGAATVSHLDLEALAAGLSSEDLVFASAAVDVVLSGGATSFIWIEHDYSLLEIESGSSRAVASSAASSVVISFDDDAAPSGPSAQGVTEPTSSGSPGYDASGLTGCACQDGDEGEDVFILNGNLAAFDVGITILDQATYADLVIDAFALQDTMSSVVINIIAIYE